MGLLAYDLLRLGRNFARMHELVCRRKLSHRTPLPDAVKRISESVNHACIWYPKRVLCLQRAAVTTWLLRSYGVPAQMVMGARKVPFKAHAWTEVDGTAINERLDVQKIYGVWERC
jgi:Transglutaminase-like superfamily